jgi:hypothetical protein
MTNLSKINNPPAAENWSRLNHPDVGSTAKEIYNFHRGQPVWSYNPAKNAARYYIEDRISRDAARRAVQMGGNKLGKPHNLLAIDGFFDFVEATPIVGLPTFAGMVDFFPFSRDEKAAIPVKPLAVTLEKGSFSVFFFIPWSNIALDAFQKQLYMTVLENSIFRLTDFQGASGKIIFVPKYEAEKGVWKRRPVIWERGSIPLLSKKELDEQLRIFAEGRKAAAVLYSDWLAKKREH